ncbi:hypothetical protein LOZ58_000037 [Ophidiomyces ophidiicola]|nr:hypothetical protein LOZ58_000037 [Ophidiomyces ophidiicola]
MDGLQQPWAHVFFGMRKREWVILVFKALGKTLFLASASCLRKEYRGGAIAIKRPIPFVWPPIRDGEENTGTIGNILHEIREQKLALVYCGSCTETADIDGEESSLLDCEIDIKQSRPLFTEGQSTQTLIETEVAFMNSISAREAEYNSSDSDKESSFIFSVTSSPFIEHISEIKEPRIEQMEASSAKGRDISRRNIYFRTKSLEEESCNAKMSTDNRWIESQPGIISPEPVTPPDQILAWGEMPYSRERKRRAAQRAQREANQRMSEMQNAKFPAHHQSSSTLTDSNEPGSLDSPEVEYQYTPQSDRHENYAPYVNPLDGIIYYFQFSPVPFMGFGNSTLGLSRSPSSQSEADDEDFMDEVALSPTPLIDGSGRRVIVDTVGWRQWNFETECKVNESVCRLSGDVRGRKDAEEGGDQYMSL